MPRIPTSQYEDDWEDPDELNIENDEPVDRAGRRIPAREHRKLRTWEEQQREAWRKRNREE